MHVATLALLMVIRTYDVFGVPSRDLDVAKWTTANILRPAGIDIQWVDCARSAAEPPDAACEEVLTADELLVRIIAGPRQRRERADRDTLGYAYVDVAATGGSLATLYADRIATMASASGIDAATLLGRAMAHEIGHLLLGTATHQSQGLMRAEWSQSTLRRRIGHDWQFTPGEIKSLARNLELRTRYERVQKLPDVPFTTEDTEDQTSLKQGYASVSSVASVVESLNVPGAAWGYHPTSFPLSCSSSHVLSGAK